MAVSKKKPDPFRRRLNGDQFMQRDQRIWQMRADGATVQSIADTVGCGLATVDRALKRLVKQQRRLSPQDDLEAELGAEVDAALAVYAGGSMKAADARTAEDIKGLNDLEFFRMRHLPADHPAQVACAALFETGWRRPPVEPLHDPRDDGQSWRAGIADEW